MVPLDVNDVVRVPGDEPAVSVLRVRDGNHNDRKHTAANEPHSMSREAGLQVAKGAAR